MGSHNEEAVRFSRAPNVGYKLQRFILILLQFIGFVAFLAQQRIGIVFGADDDAAVLSRAAAENLRGRLVHLGPTFVKGGQLLSTRADLVGPIWMEVLSSLQADVPAVPYEEIKAVILAELPKESLDRIDWIARESISAASIGQVHRAKLKKDGRQIVHKVQRPGIEELVRTDLSILRSIAQHCSVIPWLFAGQDLVGTMEQLSKTFQEELDFTREAANYARLAAACAGTPGIVIPTVLPEFSTKRILTMEYVTGASPKRLNASPEVVKKHLEHLVAGFLQQYVVEGVYHADPHPGNVSLLPDGRVVLYDCGMLGELTPTMRDTLLRIAGDAIRLDEESLVRNLVAIEILPPEAIGDPEVLEVMQQFLEGITSSGLSGETITALMKKLLARSDNARLSFPQELVLLGRSLLELEGLLAIISAQAPGVDYRRVALPHASPLLGKLLGEPIGPIERVRFDVMRLFRIVEILTRRTQRGLRQLEQGRLELPVKDTATARATRRLSPGIRSLNSAILFMTFSVLSGLSFRDDNPLLGIPLLLGGLFFMGRWLVSEQRMES